MRSVLLEAPRIELRQGPADEGEEAPRARRGASGEPRDRDARPRAASRALSLDVRRARVVRGALAVLRADGSPALRLEGLSGELEGLSLNPGAASGLAGLGGRGELAAERLSVDGRMFEDLRGRIELDAGRLVARDLGLTTREGRFTVRELEIIDARPPWPWRARLEGDPLKIGRMIGGGEARGSLTLEIEARGTEAAGRRGRGELILDAGSLPAAPWLLGLAEILGRPGLVGSAYQETRVEFTLDGDRVEIAPFALEGELLGLAGRGTADLAGPLELRVTVTTPRQGLAIDGIPPQVLDLVTDGDGRVTVPLRIGGTLEQPVVRPDTKALGRVLRDAARSRLGDALGGD